MIHVRRQWELNEQLNGIRMYVLGIALMDVLELRHAACTSNKSADAPAIAP
jgi:hypothetical protein